MNTFKMYLISGLMIMFSVTASSMTEHVSQVESDAARISMLEKALAPQKLDEVATLFAKANKERNGAVQFMLFSDQLKEKFKDRWPYWVSGVSSPWITSYEIKKVVQSKNAWKFKITYQWATADGPFNPPMVQTIVVTPVPKNINASQKFWITEFNEH
ncbi:hypothetical protein DGG96_00505 [Legionella qingyii]|uniref:DUF4019 domain-containing protein n=1 Tax=Legionella qingyii TaxID=2184757 RepID=A0A317U6N0_9GAMM|nr:hypothetical protein [Legionella qingyii]PWY57613.1 hypothetical protein DGG96_00505 [Legionella qingyii]RUR25921.1 hypothetical protein ELY20_01885 [Legionella qingyii]RUR29310.1 hypothetical protein ELY16_00510 [Legionella qingyii]